MCRARPDVATEMRAAQTTIRDLEAHQTANRSYIEEGVQLLELAHRAPALFESQSPAEKRKLLNFVLSNCTWKGGELAAKYRQPFDVLALAVASEQQMTGEGMAEQAKTEIWLPGTDSNPHLTTHLSRNIRRIGLRPDASHQDSNRESQCIKIHQTGTAPRTYTPVSQGSHGWTCYPPAGYR